MIIDKNIEILSKNPLHWIGEILPEEVYPKFLAKEKENEYFQDSNGELLLVKDKLDPTYSHHTYMKEFIIVLGINSLHEIKELHKNKHKNSIIIIIEPRLSFFTHVLNNKSMAVFDNKDIFLFADNQIENITQFLEPILAVLEFIGLVKNLTFYITDYYRKYDYELSKKLLVLLRQGIYSRVFILGNDVQDSLQGMEQNLDNIKWIMKSKNPLELKNKFKNIPAIVVAAGPSLNKNIQYLKEAQGKAVIIAVDTIIERLINEGITPDFVCAVERVREIYDYFFKDKDYPKEVTLVGPPLLDSKVFEEFNGEIVLPFRMEVSEYEWLQNVLDIPGDIGMLMGLSCAHVAFGLATHLGCSPIILTGQDLAYGTDKGQTHASGTTYDNLEQKPKNEADDDFVDGYFGKPVNTTKVWIQFKLWFETQIKHNNLKVINATEGGAKIYNTEQLTLKDTIQRYCSTPIDSVKQKVDCLGSYQINPSKVLENLEVEKLYFEDLFEKCKIQFDYLNELKITAEEFLKNRKKIEQHFYRINYLKQKVTSHKLLMHMLQAVVLQYIWESNDKEQIISVENYNKEQQAQIKFVVPVMAALSKIIKEVSETIDRLKIYKSKK